MSMSAAAAAANQKLLNVLTTPGKIARSLDWNKLSGAVLSLHIGEKTIDLAVTSHPSSFHPIQTLPSIPIDTETRENKKVLKSNVLLELASIVDEYKICGVVVSWPLQKEGWCGRTCGKVLHYIDQLVQDTSIITPSRPVCLWNGRHYANPEDEWGRLALYGRPGERDVHVASQEQYRDEGMLAADIARDYLHFHWPELAHNLGQPPSYSLRRSLVESPLLSRSMTASRKKQTSLR